jgi:hypothetical protein
MGRDWGGVDSVTRAALAERFTPTQPSPMKGEGFRLATSGAPAH